MVIYARILHLVTHLFSPLIHPLKKADYTLLQFLNLIEIWGIINN